nr:MAG TPA: hypothetical protein [Caudoviricetes sp.]
MPSPSGGEGACMCEAAGPRPPALGVGGEAGTGLRRRPYTVAIYTPPSMEVRWE